MLIQEVKNHSILYDYSHSEYRNLKKKEREWREIAATTKMNGKIICGKPLLFYSHVFQQ